MRHIITYFEIAAFIASLLAWPHLRQSKYLRLFPLLLLIIVIVEVQQTFFKVPGSSNSGIYNLQVPLQYLIYLNILHLAMEHGAARKVTFVFMVLLIIVTVVTGAFFTEPGHFNILAYGFGSVLIIIGILLKFYEMLQNPTTFNFLKNPFFYMLFAYLLFNVGTLPYFVMSNWMYFEDVPDGVIQILINVMSIFNYILYATYTIGFLWMMFRVGSFSSPRL